MASIVESIQDRPGKLPHAAKTRILVAEQESATAADVREKLLRLGYDVAAEVTTSEDAVACAASTQPDLVLADVVLGGVMDGVEAAETIGKRFRIPVVFLTALLDNETIQRAKVTEPFGFVLRPFGERELHTAIEMALYKHSMESALRLSEQKFSKAFHTSPDSISINRASDGMYVDVNAGLTALMGYTREEVCGKTSLELKIWVDPGKRRELLEGLRANGEVKNLETDFRTKDGKVVSASMSATIVDLEGEAHILSITRDVSDRKRAEHELRMSERRYREFFEQDLAGNFVSTVDGTIVDCNPSFARIFGFESVEAAKKGNPSESNRSPQQRKELHSLLQGEKKLQNVDLEARRIDGQPLFLTENLIGIFNETGEMTHIRGYIIDNTERKTLEQALHHAQKMESIGTLASGIAHDFNNVLNNILGFANQLKKYAADQSRVLRYSESIENSATRGAGLSRQLMSFVRRNNRENKVVQIEELIDEVIDLASETFPKTIKVRKHAAPLMLQVLGDRGELYQAVLNLCLNARDAIIERSDLSHEHEIVLSATIKRAGDKSLSFVRNDNANIQPFWVEISISDTGIGIPEAIRTKIFDPFFTTKERGKGTGLGLSVVYNIIKSHNGSVTVESEEGKGTTFRIVLPAVEGESVAQGSIDASSYKSAQNELIMLVDDEELMRDLGRELLEDAGYRVVVASNGQHAIDLYRSAWKEISLVVLDFIMPDLNGGQVYVQLKSINPQMKTLFCTGFAEDEMMTELLDKYGLRAIEKPFKPVRLLKLMQELLNKDNAS